VSILSDPEIVNTLKTKFVCAAMDQHDHRKRKDADGELFAKILKQANRGLDGQSQGYYLIGPDGTLLAFSNAVSEDAMKRLIATALKKFDPKAEVAAPKGGEKDPRFDYKPPADGLVVTVTAKVLGGYEKTAKAAAIYQDALGLDHLWVRKDEAAALARGEFPDSLKSRLVRFHLVDNTRGEPPFWRADEVRKAEFALKDGRLTGTVHLETKSEDRGFQAEVFGLVATEKGAVTRFDVVAKGEFWGEGAFTRNAPKGKFPFAVAFTLTPKDDPGRNVPPGAARGNAAGYLR
jgi:hypothetical protein